MSSALKCPNPSCPYLFDPSRVPAGVILTCPRCAMRFTLGTPTAATNSPAPGPTTPPQVPSELTFETAPTRPPRPPAANGQPPTAMTDADADEAEAIDRAGRRQTITLAVIVAVLLAGAGLAIYFQATSDPGPVHGRGGTEMPDFNFSFDPPGSAWSADDEMKVKLGAPVKLVYHRLDPDAYIAVGARDYDTRQPRAGELQDGLMGPLRKLFENVRVEADVPKAKWLGQDARAFQFRAQSREGNVGGVCHAVSYKGIAYWAICWCGENDVEAVLPQFEAAREKFHLMDRREKWQPREGTTRDFRGEKADYRLTDAEGVWQAADTRAEDEDPQADLYLKAKLKRRGQDFANEAELLVFVVDGGGGDPLQDARKYVEARRTAEIRRANAEFTPTFKELTGDPDGPPSPNAGEPHSPVVRLQSTVPGASNQSRLIVVSGTRVGGKLVVVQAWCEWAERPAFETVFMQMAGSLRPGK